MFNLHVLHHFVALERDCVLLPLPFVCTLPHQKRPVARNILRRETAERKKETGEAGRVGNRKHLRKCYPPNAFSLASRAMLLLHSSATSIHHLPQQGGKQNILQEIGWRKTVRGARHERCAGVETANANHTCSRLTASSREMVPWKYLSCVGVKW